MKDSSSLSPFRPALPDDAEHMVNLLVPLFHKVGAVYGIRPDAESIISTVMHTIKRGVCLVGDTACAGGFIHPYVWNHEAKIGVVLFWNYTTPSGIKVFPALKQALLDHGATHINCASHFPDNRIGRYYRRHGINPTEIQYLGKL